MTIWSIHIVCWIPKTANTHSKYAILIAFPLQQQLHQHASALRYTFIAYHDTSKPHRKLKYGARAKCSEFHTKLVGYYNSYSVARCQHTFRSCFLLKNSRVQISNDRPAVVTVVFIPPLQKNYKIKLRAEIKLPAVRPRTFSSPPLPVHYRPVILTFDATQSELVRILSSEL
jgi:hypothetical protein